MNPFFVFLGVGIALWSAQGAPRQAATEIRTMSVTTMPITPPARKK